MTTQAQRILASLESLPTDERQELVVEIIRRSRDLGALPLTDGELASIAAATSCSDTRTS
jgi:hypothetical protein